MSADTPWHRLGNTITDPTNVARSLKEAHLDWRVELKSLSYHHNHSMHVSRLRRAVVRDTDSRELATVGSTYHPLQNAEAFEVLQPACDQLGVRIETAGAIGAGDRVWMLAKLPQTIQIVPGDTLEEYLLILTGHNGWTGYTARGTDLRVACANTIAIATRGSRAVITLKHTVNLSEQLDQVASIITKLVQAAKVRATSFRQMADARLSVEQLRRFVNEVLDLDDSVGDETVKGRRRAKILELAATGRGAEITPGSLWTGVNSIIEYVDHWRPLEVKSLKTIRQANESALFGHNAHLKVRALELARRMVA